MFRFWFFVCFFASGFGNNIELGEPSCLSRFDYDFKMLTKMVDIEAQHRRLKDLVEEQYKLMTAKLDNTLLRIGEEGNNQKRQITQLKEQIDQILRTQSLRQKDYAGSTYVRWGRTSCPSNGTEIVYHGYAGGSFYSKTGAAPEYLCLPEDPIWGQYEDSVNSVSAGVYGAEYELDQRTISSFFKTNLNRDDDVPCAVCRTKRSSIHLIPGRNQCFDGWTLEYHGYLSGGYEGHAASSEFVCLDVAPEAISGGQSSENLNGKLFYFAEARCGSLPCPPYVNGRELTCAVCSK